MSRAMVKLHAHDRTQLAVLAYQTGLVFAGGARAAAAAAHRIAGRIAARIDRYPAFGWIARAARVSRCRRIGASSAAPLTAR